MQTIDYIILGSYLLFLMAMGPVFRSFSRTASDFFRAGGTMLWWAAGCAVIMGGFSAWSFTGGAARAYETGLFFCVLFACNFVATIFQYWLAPKFRQMRVVTAVEAIRNRFGPTNEQVFTWIPVPIGIFLGGIGLYTLSVFVGGVFGFDLKLLILVLGITVMVMGVAGGAWAVNASQFVQTLLFMAITIVMVYTTLSHPKIGGVSGLIDQLPASHFDWTQFARPGVLVAFMVTLLLNQFIQMNAINAGAARFITVKDGRDAKRVVIMSLVAMLVMTPMWMIPPLGSVILHPNLASEYATLNNPNEAAYVAMAQTTLPPGLLGLLVCAIFSASLDNLSGGITGASAVLVRNFYIRVINPNASDKRQILIGRLLSIVCGVTMMLVALLVSQMKELRLFDLILLVAASLGLPQAVPLFWGLFVRRAPHWALWSTVAVGFVTSLAIYFVLNVAISPETLKSSWPGGPPLSARELADLKLSITTAVLLITCTAWYFGAAFLGRQSTSERLQVEAFFKQMNTPIDPRSEHSGEAHESDQKQYRTLAVLSMVYGGFIALTASFPNTSSGRLGLLVCGVSIAGIGVGLELLGRWRARAARNLSVAGARTTVADASAPA